MDDNFNFDLLPAFGHYVSSRDKTNINPTMVVKNSKNIYKKNNGNFANRPGLKARGPVNTTASGVVADCVWKTSFSPERVIRVTADGTLSVEYDAADGNGPQWYNILTGLTKTRFQFRQWYDVTQWKEVLLSVNGSVGTVYEWPGGIAVVSSTGPLVTGLINPDGSTVTISAGGGGYKIDDLLTITGGNNDGVVKVLTVTGGTITGFLTVTSQGSGYTAGVFPTTGGSGAGATVTIGSVTSGYSLTKTGTDSFTKAGFSKKSTEVATWQFIYNGISYQYGGGQDTTTLTGIVTDPSAIPVGSVIVSAMITRSNLPKTFLSNINGGFTNDMIEVINNQLVIASYNNVLVWGSRDSDYTDFTVVVNPALGTPFADALDNKPTGISVTKDNKLVVFGGTSDFTEISFVTDTIYQSNITPALVVARTVFNVVTLSGNSAPISQEFIDTDGNYIVWLGQDHQLHVLGAFSNLFLSDKAPSISTEVEEEFNAIDFTGGAVRLIDDKIYITAPLISTHFIYQKREFVNKDGTATTERIWNPPHISGISRFNSIAGDVYGYDAVHPMLYQIWDTNQWYDDAADGSKLPYESVLAMAYRQMQIKGSNTRFLKGRFDKIYVEGYMERGTPIFGKVYFDYQGAKDVQIVEINSVDHPAKIYSYVDAPSLGQNDLGDNPLGDGITPFVDEFDYIPKFRSIRKFKMKNVFEYGIELFTYEEGARWEIITAGVNMELSPEAPKDLIA